MIILLLLFSFLSAIVHLGYLRANLGPFSSLNFLRKNAQAHNTKFVVTDWKEFVMNLKHELFCEIVSL